MSEIAIKKLQQAEILKAEKAGEDFFLDLPDAWYEPHPNYGCNNGHASSRYLKSEQKGCVCLECGFPVVLLPGKYNTDEALTKALEDAKSKEENANV